MIKILLAAMISLSIITACGRNNDETPTPTPNTADNANVADDMQNAMDDVEDGVGDAVKSTGDAIKDTGDAVKNMSGKR